ncbi:NAD-dependent epimerase/dehydratase [Legionella nautarum]|uniref:NAD-dependent epimerase/dehydratase n=1 Tax=Legionella nautarum TaxID=45070 RepID=A0A0W0WKT1_9GAMM|nr:SDR family oxidoreductase [Legionella nautarum]KTD32937.1 NAD-dependent epimerase/dehydratase [Legionella nautarum]
MSPYFFIFGFGYTAQALAPKLIQQGFKVVGTSRTPNQQERNNSDIKLIDFDCPSIENHLALATHLLISIPPTPTLSDIVLIKYSELIKQQAPNLRWLGYLSSTGVYGNHEGNWVTEDSECIPHTPTGIARLKAEHAWFSFAQQHQLPLHVFRLSGIYGPRRNVIERLMQGKNQTVFKENQVFCRVHLDDIVTTLLASIQLPKPLSIYNVSDDEPAPAHVVDRYATNLLHREPLPLIPFLEARLSPMEQEFYTNNRRVSNLKIKKELGVVLKYPSYREGLTQIWRNDFAPQ